MNCHTSRTHFQNLNLFLQAQQKECVDSSQGSHGGIHSNSHNVSGGFSSRIPAFSSPLCHESNEDEDSETSHSEDNQKPLKPSKNKSSGSATKVAEPLYEEDVIDGFAIISFSTYEELEVGHIRQVHHIQQHSDSCATCHIVYRMQ